MHSSSNLQFINILGDLWNGMELNEISAEQGLLKIKVTQEHVGTPLHYLALACYGDFTFSDVAPSQGWVRHIRHVTYMVFDKSKTT